MTTALGYPEQRVVLENISWDIYESLLTAHRDRSVPRFTYDRGQLEIMSPSAEHEQIKETLALLVNILAEETEINVKGFGSTTLRRQDLGRGFEPDTCFYVGNLDLVRGKTELDPRVDPPPDLLIEVDITSSSLDKLSIMAEVGVPEVWRYGRQGCRILRLQRGGYTEQLESAALPAVTAEAITDLVEESGRLEPLAWIRVVREWARLRLRR